LILRGNAGGSKQHKNFFLFAKGDGGQMRGGHEIVQNDETEEKKELSTDTNSTLNDGEWHEIWLTYNGSKLRIYRDGYLDGVKEIGPAAYQSGSPAPVVIGAREAADPEEPKHWFRGCIDDIKLYDKVIVPSVSVPFDIKPGSCPNRLNIRSKGLLRIAILGTGEVDATNIDPASVRLEGVAPIRSQIEDVSQPVIDPQDICDCSEEPGDAFDDLTLTFKKKEIVCELGDVSDGDEVVLTLTGETFDRTRIEGQDCVLIRKKGND
jgi:hypothetical protein